MEYRPDNVGEEQVRCRDFLDLVALAVLLTWKHRHYSQFWIGDVGLGLRLKLLPHGSEYDSGQFWIDDSNVPTSSWAGQAVGQRDRVWNQVFSNETLFAGGVNVSSDAANQTISIVAFSGPRTLSPGETASFRFQILLTPSQPLNASAHFNQRYLQSGAPTPSPCGQACAKQWIDRMVSDGYTILNLHQGSFPMNPYGKSDALSIRLCAVQSR